MVEDYWRAVLPAMQSQNLAVAQEIGQRFEQRIQQAAAQLPPIDAAAFLQAVEAEREKILAEYQSNPGALKTRLGVPLGIDAPLKTARPTSGSSLGELAVRTAVRATIWESIWALFRSVR